MLKAAIVGAGNITSLRHIPALKASRRVELYGVIDNNVERARRVAGKNGIPHFGTSLDEAWAKDIGVATIGVPPHAHYAVCKRALESNWHVLLEKPMALRVEEGEELRGLAQQRGRVLAVVQNFQFARSAEALKSRIKRGLLGDVQGIFCYQCSTTERRLPVWHEELPLGLFYDESPHLLYLLTAFGGEVEVADVTIVQSQRGRVTPALVTGHFRAGGVPAFLYNNFEAPISEWHFAVYGSKAVGIIDVFRDLLVTIPNDGQHLATDVLQSSAFLTGTHLWGVLTAGLRILRGAHLYGNDVVVRQFLDAVEFNTPLHGISADDGLRVLRLQHELIRQARVVPGFGGKPEYQSATSDAAHSRAANPAVDV